MCRMPSPSPGPLRGEPDLELLQLDGEVTQMASHIEPSASAINPLTADENARRPVERVA